MNKSFLLITIIFASLNSELKPQVQDTNAFSNVKFSINFIKNKSTDALNRYWDGPKGLEGEIQMPFYLGNIQGGARYIPYKEKAINFHNFSSYFIYLGWGYEFKLPYDCSFYAGIKVGGYRMSVHDDSLSDELKFENELAAGLRTYLAFNIYADCSLNLGADYTKVYIYKKIELFVLSAGISYSFQSPEWLKDFLK